MRRVKLRNLIAASVYMRIGNEALTHYYYYCYALKSFKKLRGTTIIQISGIVEFELYEVNMKENHNS